ncbi:MAG: hypothetical protein QM755_06685 [Luteolibacter sp.]
MKRFPGDHEVQEEFVRLLLDGERFDDAGVELQRLTGANAGDSGLWLQLAAVRFRQQKPEEVLEALRKAHALLGNDVPSGIRIAGLMMQYGLGEQAETLLKQLAATPGAGTAAQETLASYYGRSQRKSDAVALLKQIAASDDADTVLRAAEERWPDWGRTGKRSRCSRRV